MTISGAVAKARRELKKIHNSDYTYLSNEHFRIGKLNKFIELHVNKKGKSNVFYHRDNKIIEIELNGILNWNRTSLNIKK